MRPRWSIERTNAATSRTGVSKRPRALGRRGRVPVEVRDREPAVPLEHLPDVEVAVHPAGRGAGRPAEPSPARRGSRRRERRAAPPRSPSVTAIASAATASADRRHRSAVAASATRVGSGMHVGGRRERRVHPRGDDPQGGRGRSTGGVLVVGPAVEPAEQALEVPVPAVPSAGQVGGRRRDHDLVPPWRGPSKGAERGRQRREPDRGEVRRQVEAGLRTGRGERIQLDDRGAPDDGRLVGLIDVDRGLVVAGRAGASGVRPTTPEKAPACTPPRIRRRIAAETPSPGTARRGSSPSSRDRHDEVAGLVRRHREADAGPSSSTSSGSAPAAGSEAPARRGGARTGRRERRAASPSPAPGDRAPRSPPWRRAYGQARATGRASGVDLARAIPVAAGHRRMARPEDRARFLAPISSGEDRHAHDRHAPNAAIGARPRRRRGARRVARAPGRRAGTARSPSRRAHDPRRPS